MALVECNDICLSYENTIVADKLSFSVNEGDYLCIVGENGSGKSTLVKAILGLKSISGGKIKFNGITSRQIGYLPQQTTVQRDFPASVFEVVLSGCLSEKKGHIFFSKKLKNKALENLRKLDIKNLKNRCYRELSGGQQQRVLLARALCAADKLLLLDEPVTGLDPVVTADFYRLIEKLNKEYKMTIIMVSHDLLCAVSSADHILHLNKEFSFFGTANEYLKSDIFSTFKGGAENG